jgi:histidinol-phosphate/aromatic aminotransferase/cobyric acid decarboxylase-like protein
VQTVTLSQTDTERCLALVDNRGDLYLVPNPSAPAAKTYKLGKVIDVFIAISLAT